MKSLYFVIALLFCSVSLFSQEQDAERAGNPVIDGWYADPEGTVFGNQYWIFPTFSAPYDEQVHMMRSLLPI